MKTLKEISQLTQPFNGQNRQAVERYRRLPKDRRLSFYFHLNSCGDKIFKGNLFLFLKSEFDNCYLTYF